MDYWGYGPFQNCDAINFINCFRFPFPISFSRIVYLYYRTSNPEEERVVIQLYLNSSHCEDKFTDKWKNMLLPLHFASLSALREEPLPNNQRPIQLTIPITKGSLILINPEHIVAVCPYDFNSDWERNKLGVITGNQIVADRSASKITLDLIESQIEKISKDSYQGINTSTTTTRTTNQVREYVVFETVEEIKEMSN